MKKNARRQCAAAAAMGILAWCGVVAAQAPAPDPWSKVPALPAASSCYVNDGFAGKVDTAIASLDADIARQTKLNTEIKASYNSLDGAEKARRMQAYMMKNPQAAMKMMQGLQAAGTAVDSSIGTAAQTKSRLEQEFKTHAAEFGAAVGNAERPVRAKLASFAAAKGIQGEGGVGFRPADQPQYEALVKEQNAAYEKVCASFFGPAGAFQGWLASYKKYVPDSIAAQMTLDQVTVSQMAIMDTPAGGYRSTAPLKGVRDYVNQVGAVYRLRRGGLIVATK